MRPLRYIQFPRVSEKNARMELCGQGEGLRYNLTYAFRGAVSNECFVNFLLMFVSLVLIVCNFSRYSFLPGISRISSVGISFQYGKQNYAIRIRISRC